MVERVSLAQSLRSEIAERGHLPAQKGTDSPRKKLQKARPQRCGTVARAIRISSIEELSLDMRPRRKNAS